MQKQAHINSTQLHRIASCKGLRSHLSAVDRWFEFRPAQTIEYKLASSSSSRII